MHIYIYTLQVPERNEKCFRVSSSVKGKPLLTPPSGREWEPNKSRDKHSPSTHRQRPSRRAEERVEVRATSCP